MNDEEKIPEETKIEDNKQEVIDPEESTTDQAKFYFPVTGAIIIGILIVIAIVCIIVLSIYNK